MVLAGVEVSRLGLGTMSLTGRGTWGTPADPAGAHSLLRRATELGVQLFDTADSYGPEVAENLLREALHPYDGLLIATKGGFRRHGPHEWSADCRPEALRAACEGSLRRLALERIDLYQLHVVDAAVPIEESVGALAELQAEGKVGAIGVCNVDLVELTRARSMAEIVSVQNRLSLAEQGSEDVLARCDLEGLAFIAWAPLAKGFLAEEGSTRARVERAHGATASQVALAWLLHCSPRLAVIPGTGSAQHLEENVAAGALSLLPAEIGALGRERFWSYRTRSVVKKARKGAGRARRELRGKAR